MTESYTHLDYSIELENNINYLKIKIKNNSLNNYYEKNISINDITLDCLDEYYLLIQASLLNKTNYLIKFIEYIDKIDMIIIYKSTNDVVTETISLIKYTDNEIIDLKNQIIKMSKEISDLKLIINLQKQLSNKIQIGYIQKIWRNISINKVSNIEHEYIEFDELTDFIEYKFITENEYNYFERKDNYNDNRCTNENNDYLKKIIIFNNFDFGKKFPNLKKISTDLFWKFCNLISYTDNNINFYDEFYNLYLEELTIKNFNLLFTGNYRLNAKYNFPNLKYLKIIETIFNNTDIKVKAIIWLKNLVIRMKKIMQIDININFDDPDSKLNFEIDELKLYCEENNIILNFF